MYENSLPLIVKALAFSARKHRDQRRKDIEATPYVNHPINLMDILVNEAGISDTETLLTALLHDTIEDTETTFEELENEFGLVIASLVMEVSDDKSLSKLERKAMQVSHAPELSDKAKLVKLADKISNLRDIKRSPPVGWELSRVQAYFDWAKRVIDGLKGTHSGLEKLFDEIHQKRPQ
ncbi:MAG: HD domain-containing protein [Candidatus Thiodiazotropha sp.]|jgi:GTP diphosphokinase / guanosine-3',5'-bis(diphosphate) 3'-diphosphatase